MAALLRSCSMPATMTVTKKKRLTKFETTPSIGHVQVGKNTELYTLDSEVTEV